MPCLWGPVPSGWTSRAVHSQNEPICFKLICSSPYLLSSPKAASGQSQADSPHHCKDHFQDTGRSILNLSLQNHVIWDRVFPCLEPPCALSTGVGREETAKHGRERGGETHEERGPRQGISVALQTAAEGACQEGVNKKVPEDGRLEGESVFTAVNYSQRSQRDICFLQATPPPPHQLPGKQPPPHGGRVPPLDCGPGQEGQKGENHRPREESSL